MSGRLSTEERELFRALADALLPALPPLPSASEAAVAGDIIDRILEWRPDLTRDFLRALARSRTAPPALALAALERDDAEAFAAIRMATLGAYYLDPAVRRAFGYRGQESRPVPTDERADYLDPGLLDPVRRRGPTWRRC